MPRVLVSRTCSSVSRARLALATLTCALALGMTVAAHPASATRVHHTATVAAHRLSLTPPVALGNAASGAVHTSSTSAPRATSASGTASAASPVTRLPATGYDAAMAALLGVGLLLGGLGLRRLTADGRRS